MILLKNPEQIAGMRKAGALLYEVLQTLREEVRPGMSTKDIDRRAEELIRRPGAIPSFLHYDGFPASICTSVNDVVVHGVPSDDEMLQEGDILSLDCGLVLDGWQADSALTVPVGKVSREAEELIAVTEACFFAGARMARVGKTLGDIGYAVQREAEAHGYGVVRDLSGHGIGRDMHEDPYVYNFGIPGEGFAIRRGMTIAIEPMITQGDWHIEMEDDGTNIRTRDGLLASHYEHTLAIVDDRPPELLTYPGYVWKEEA
jgi:methionyl aminopeptidase